MKFREVPRAQLPTRYGEFTVYGFEDEESGEEALALVCGSQAPDAPPLVRIHSQCLTGDVFRSERCDCGDQMQEALRLVHESKHGIFIYQEKEGRGIGLINKIRAYQLQDQGLDTVAANEKLGFKPDLRDYRMPAAILQYLGVRRIRLLSNNPDKVRGLEEEGIEVVERVPLEIPPNSSTESYLRAKKEKLGHILTQV
jgi:3,4-dihydroxy 2-butanone 4-phosphate synthase/GTP cyclohydrolase II